EVTGPELTSELVHEAVVKARQQTAVVHIVIGRLGCVTVWMVFLLPLQGPSFFGSSGHSVSFFCGEERHTASFIPSRPSRHLFSSPVFSSLALSGVSSPASNELHLHVPTGPGGEPQPSTVR